MPLSAVLGGLGSAALLFSVAVATSTLSLLVGAISGSDGQVGGTKGEFELRGELP